MKILSQTGFGLKLPLVIQSVTHGPALALSGFLLVSLLAAPVKADTVAVNAADNIYAAGQTSTDNFGGGNLPVGIVVPTGATYFEIGGVTGSYTSANSSCPSNTFGCVTINGGGNYNDADGNYAAVSSSTNTGTNSISGIDFPGAGELVGVFVASGGPSGPAPTTLDYRPGGNASVNAASYSPLLDQVFFIGDGCVGDVSVGQSCTPQTFNAPTGATELYLGISDSGGYNGSPGAYGDNFGNFSATYSFASSTSAVPEPATFPVVAGGLSLVLLALRSRRKA